MAMRSEAEVDRLLAATAAEYIDEEQMAAAEESHEAAAASAVFSVRLSPTTYDAVRAAADRAHLTPSALIRQVVTERVQEAASDDLTAAVATLRRDVERVADLVRPSVPDEEANTYFEDMLQGGDQEHLSAALPEARPLLARIAAALDLLAHPLAQLGPEDAEPLAPNVVVSVACLASAFRGLRAATLLALTGYPSEARSVVRRTYEAAGLARMLAHEPALAERWLKGKWFSDGEVRRWFGVQSTPGEPPSPYQEYYNEATDFAHPTLRSAGPLLLATTSTGQLQLETSTDITEALVVLREIAAEGVFVCFALRNSLVHPEVLPPAWHQRLTALAEEAGADLPHLQRDWQAAQPAFDRLMAAVMPSDAVDAYLASHPNSYNKIRRRTEEEPQ